MKKTVYFVQVAILLWAGWSLTSQAEDIWQTIVRAPGQIETAILSPQDNIWVTIPWQIEKFNSQGKADHVITYPQSNRIFLSPGGTKYARIDYQGAGDIAQAASVSVHDAEGGMLWSIQDHPLNDLVVLEDGSVVAAHRNINLRETQVYFISNQGKLIKDFTVSALGEIKASLAGNRVLINSGIDGAQLYNAAGEHLASLGPCYRSVFSRDGQMLAILYGQELSIYLNGTPVYQGTLGSEIVRGVDFLADNTQFAAFTDHHLYLIEIGSGKLLIERQLDPSGQLSFTSVALRQNGQHIAVGLERDLGGSVIGPERHPDGQIRLYDRFGNQVYSREVTFTNWNTTTPAVAFDSEGRYLLVRTRDELIKAPVADLLKKGGQR